MAWTTPRTWADDEIVTTAYMNAQIRDNFNALTAHTHGGSAGDGSATLASGVSFTGLATVTFADQSGNPSVAGRLQRNGSTLVYYNGSAVVSLGTADASAGTASLRTLGTGSTNAAAGNHNHTPTTPSTSALTGSEVTSESASRTFYKKGYSADATIDGTSKTVTPTLTANMVIISCFIASADGEAALGKVNIIETVGGTPATVQTGITSRFTERAAGSTIYCAYGADYIERTDRSAATYTYHLVANDSVNLSAAYLIATVVQA
jgi:hypothetical protein